MERHYVPLRSGPATHDGGSSSTSGSSAGSSQVPEVKRRRVGVAVACNACRRKKIRCNGKRPICTNCEGSASDCSYRDESELSQESKKLIVEVVHTLHSMEAGHLIRTLRTLNTETNAHIMLSTLRDEVIARKEPPTSSEATAIPNINQARFEFEAQNPTAYPLIVPVDVNKLRYSRTVLPSTSEDRHSSVRSFSDNAAYNPLALSQPAIDVGQDKCRPTTSIHLCDPRLKELNIQGWTDVGIDDDTAARCISLYLETDHPLLGHFDPNLFVSDLVYQRNEYCSSLLVNALLYWACQMYSSIDSKTSHFAIQFCTEAEKLWAVEIRNSRDTITTIAAAEFLCLGYLGQGRDSVILAYVSDASHMGQRMGLFGVDAPEGIVNTCDVKEEADESTRARMYTAWGVCNWIILMSLFYRQPGMSCPKHLPQSAIPACIHQPALEYMGTTFPQICRFWSILHEVSLVYSGDGVEPWGSGSTPLFAEFKFRELLAWSNNLPSRLSQGYDYLHHVQILHLWFHAAILDIFRPYINDNQGNVRLRTFSSSHTTANTVCDASVAQLKHLIFDYRLNYQSSTYTILWHTALIYVINAILAEERVHNWYSDLLLCIYAYESLGRSWRLAAGIAKGLLSLTMQKTNMTSATARRILDDVEKDHVNEISGEIRATFMADLDLALSDPSSATVEHLAKQFEENALLKEFTTILESNEIPEK